MIMRCLVFLVVYAVFFFKQKTAYEMRISDWSSDVCSSDLALAIRRAEGDDDPQRGIQASQPLKHGDPAIEADPVVDAGKHLHDRAVVLRHRRRQPGKAACGGGHPLDPVTWSRGEGPQPPGLLAPSSSGSMWARMKKICEVTKTKVRARMDRKSTRLNSSH